MHRSDDAPPLDQDEGVQLKVRLPIQGITGSLSLGGLIKQPTEYTHDQGKLDPGHPTL